MLANRPSLLTLTLASLFVYALFLLSPSRLLQSVAASGPLPVETSVLSDDFNDSRLDTTKWRYSNASSASIVLEQNQRLEIPLRPNATGYYGIQTLGTHDLREKTVSVDLLQATSQGGWAETYFQIKRDESNYYHMSVGAGSFVFDAWTNGVRDRTVLSYDPVNHRYWRFRHDAASNTMNFETSANGTAWTTQKIVLVGFPIDSMYAVMLAGAWGTGNSTPGAAIFDNFTIKSNSVNQPPTVTLTKPAHNATFGRGSTVTLAANAADADGGIQRVEFFEGPNKLGEDFTAPFSIPWGNVKPGNYFITARATDVSGAMTTSNASYIAVSNAPSVEALLVVADSFNLPSSDAVIKARLENLGFTVTVKDAVSAASSDATNKSLVYISETVASANVTTKFRDVAVPVISAESQLFDDMLMTGPTNETDYGTAVGQNQTIILNPSHPLAAGCTGTVTVSTQVSLAAWGRPAASAAQVASMSYDGTKKGIFAYESGAMMVGMQAPARRVGLFHGNDAFNSLTENGAALFDAAVRWATTTPSFVQYPRDNTAAAIPGTIQVELFDEGGEGTAYHDLSPGNEASNSYRYPTDVDAWDGGIGNAQAGEWTEYTVNVGATAAYRADVSVAAASTGGTFHIEFDGLDVTGPMVVPNTGSWGAYQTVSKSGINLSAGQHLMRLVMDTGGSNGYVANFDSVKFLVPNSATDLLAYWKMDEASGSALNDSAGSNAGALSGPTRVAGRVGAGALSFDGVDDRVTVTSSPALTAIANNFTVSFWAYPRSAHQIDAEGYLYGGTTGQKYAFEPRYRSETDPGAGISIGTNGVSVYEHTANYMPAQLVYQTPLTAWTHITLVYENKQPRLYINGALVRTGLTSTRPNVLLYPADIGGMPYGYYDGLLDDIRVYGRALNSAEVSALATADGGNATTEFSMAQNPNGVWSYGWRTASAPFKLYPNHDQSTGNVGTWYDASIVTDQWNLPVVAHGPTSPLIHMHPGPRGEQTIVRWTAPTATTVNISGRFENMNSATTDVHVIHNSTASLFDGAINGGGSVAPFSIRKTVAAGDTLDFVVGWGSNGNYNSDSTGLALNITPDPGSAYDDTKTAIPGTIEAERFNNGGEGIGYHDTTPGSSGVDYDQPAPYPPATFRLPTDVDIYKHVSYSNNHLVLMQAGDWMKYNVNVSATGSYKLQARVIWGGTNGGSLGTFHIEMDGVDITGPLQIPDTNWAQWSILTKPNVMLQAGQHVMRVVADTNASNGTTGDIDSILFSGINDAAFLSQSIPTTMVAGQTYNGSITMKNTGSTTWSTAGNYNLGSQNPQDNLTWGGARIGLPATVTPGSNVTFSFSVKAPSTPGTYNLQAKMVQDTVEWFGALTSNVAVTVTATPNQLPTARAGGPYSVTTATPLQFSGAASSDADGSISTYAWNFGDGQSGTGVNPLHGYAASGVYTVTLTVTDNVGGVGSATATVTVVPPPAAPSALTATAPSANQINLSWADNSTNETSFQIERATQAGGPYATVTTVGANSTAWTDTTVSAGVTYFYRVRSAISVGYSAYSNEASATTLAQPAAGARYSLSLNGVNGYVLVPNNSTLNISGPITVEAWIKTNSTALQGIVERYNWLSTDDGGYALRIEQGQLTFYTIRNSGSYDFVRGGTAVSVGVWHHVAGVFDGSQLRVYLDGREDGVKASTVAPASGTQSLKIGARGNDAATNFNGLIDEVRVSSGVQYRGNFTAMSLHDTGDVITDPGGGQRGLWAFDTATAKDDTGSGNNGTLVGGALISTETFGQNMKYENLMASSTSAAADRQVVIGFDEFVNKKLGDQYPDAKFKGLSIIDGREYFTFATNWGPHFGETGARLTRISDAAIAAGQTTIFGRYANFQVDFPAPASNISFEGIGVDNFYTTLTPCAASAWLDVYFTTDPDHEIPFRMPLCSRKFGEDPPGKPFLWELNKNGIKNARRLIFHSILDNPDGVDFDTFKFTVPAPAAVNIADNKANLSKRVSGNLENSLQKSLMGSQIMLKANGNSAGGSYQWSFTGPVENVSGTNTNTVAFSTNVDDNVVAKKDVYRVTAKVVFTDSQGSKGEATVNIDVHVPTLPEYSGTQSASTLEMDSEKKSVIWQIGSTDPNNPQPAMTFNAKARIPSGAYLSDLSDGTAFFQQAISTMRKVRDTWGRVSCKTSRTPTQTDVESGWQGDIRTVALRDLSVNANRKFSDAVSDTGTLALSLNVREGIEGLKFRMRDVDAAQVDDRYETYVFYESGNFSRRLGSVSWKWGGTQVFDTQASGKIPPPDFNVYALRHGQNKTGNIPQDVPVSPRKLTAVNTTLRWERCMDEHEQPLEYRLINNQHLYVSELYEDFLKRDPLDSFDINEIVGWYYWASNITKNEFDEAAIDGYHVQTALAFIFSQEYVQLHQGANDPLRGLSADLHTEAYNRAFVKACYFGFLKRDDPFKYPDGKFHSGSRDPEIDDPVGFQWWVDRLNEKNHLTDWSAYFETVHAFLVSQEYLDRYETFKRNPIPEIFDNPAPTPQQQP